eukprot:CAMPEP_0170585880 /NCGR_PEP_ID=MMETSP0224-20130122/9452_1 /TAXON_ID=285029 /ORGANISM="Togula jolla, Strain CCCM 725" /LENGTH=328 /DNA_ID=CAMNT_0010909399 /DNA_START=32 /DNA_END=1019 /DNA_ORIENTATION=-
MEINPTTTGERAFATVVLLVAFIISSLFVSSMTNLMVADSSLRSSQTRLTSQMLQFMADRNISSTLVGRAKKFLDHRITSPVLLANQVTMLKALPRNMREDIYEEMYSKTLFLHKLFLDLSHISPAVLRDLSHEALAEVAEVPESCVFSTGDACTKMFFVASGKFRYLEGIRSIGLPSKRLSDGTRSLSPKASNPNPQKEQQVARQQQQEAQAQAQKRTKLWSNSRTAFGEPNVVIGKGHWLSEAVLYTTWFNVGELTAMSYSLLVTLKADDFVKVVSAYPTAHHIAAEYAVAFVEELNTMVKSNNQPNDLMLPGQIAHKWAWELASA